jgi:hypothetical protein
MNEDERGPCVDHSWKIIACGVSVKEPEGKRPCWEAKINGRIVINWFLNCVTGFELY